jgi:hypothetical protein
VSSLATHVVLLTTSAAQLLLLLTTAPVRAMLTGDLIPEMQEA